MTPLVSAAEGGTIPRMRRRVAELSLLVASLALALAAADLAAAWLLSQPPKKYPVALFPEDRVRNSAGFRDYEYPRREGARRLPRPRRRRLLHLRRRHRLRRRLAEAAGALPRPVPGRPGPALPGPEPRGAGHRDRPARSRMLHGYVRALAPRPDRARLLPQRRRGRSGPRGPRGAAGADLPRQAGEGERRRRLAPRHWTLYRLVRLRLHNSADEPRATSTTTTRSTGRTTPAGRRRSSPSPTSGRSAGRAASPWWRWSSRSSRGTWATATPSRASTPALASAFAKAGIPCLDLRAAYRGLDHVTLEAVPFTDPHPSDVAQRIAAERLFKFLDGKGLLPKDGRTGTNRQVPPPWS